jgi:hypothetical protein
MTTTLLEPHRAKLLACGLTPETWQRAQLHSGSAAEVREVLGYGVQGGGLVIPYSERYARVRIDNPGPDGKRYRSPKDRGNRLYVPLTLEPGILGNPALPLHLTEGEFKALKATQEGIPCLALPGVWSWKQKLHGQSIPIPDLDRVVWHRRKVVVVFDSDAKDKPAVAWAEHALVIELRERGAAVSLVRLPTGPKGEKYGLDDYLVAEGVAAFKALPMQTPQEVDAEQSPYRRLSDLADEYLLRVSTDHHRDQFGYQELDGIVRGLAASEVCTILARTGVGKTALGLNLIRRMTDDTKLPAMMFSLEMQGTEIFERLVSMDSGVPGREIEERANAEDPQIIARLRETVEHGDHIVIVEKPCTLEDLDKHLTVARDGSLLPSPLRLVFIDYLGMVGSDARGARPIYEQVSRVARGIKQLAKRHRVAVLLACQVDREGGNGGTPIDLKAARDSGAIDEAADYLLGCWRPGLDTELSKDERRARRHEFVVRVLKNRSGPSARSVTLHFDPTSLRISSPVSPSADPEPGWVRSESVS